MIRIVIGSIVGGIVQFIVGAIAWATPLGKLAFTALGEIPTADVQNSLARTLAPTGTGTYFVPSPETAAGTILLGKGPVALIFFNTHGFPPMEPTGLLVGLILSCAMLLLIGFAIAPLRSFDQRMRVVVLFAVAMVTYFVFALPVYNFYMPWGWWAFLGTQEIIGFLAGAFVMIRWFMPVTAPETAPR